SYWWEDADSVTYACLANDKSLVLEKTPDNYSPFDLYFQLYDDIDEDNELDTLWGFEVNISFNAHWDSPVWPCRYLVDNEELESAQHENALELRQETVYINVVEESSLMIYDYSGRLRYTQAMTRGKHEVSKNTLGLPSGLYIVQLLSESGQGHIAKKMVVY
ncbi:MAG TPA: T9SS type A sorting domain-containing protein, partial [Saprospiraceae bacterium]|nr:T9SS type A sorting domain-containing protein [Saprospiraceae bacterium]